MTNAVRVLVIRPIMVTNGPKNLWTEKKSKIRTNLEEQSFGNDRVDFSPSHETWEEGDKDAQTTDMNPRTGALSCFAGTNS
jgi:hypothetical protein